jgi:RNA polymerase sigma-70 factor (ECF subfamily)
VACDHAVLRTADPHIPDARHANWIRAAVAEAKGPEAGLAVLDVIDIKSVSGYQPYWAVRAHLLQRLAKTSEAADAFDQAIGLAEDPAVRQFLFQRRG